MEHTPKSLTIYGAGVIGCEYASIFCNLDVKVNLVNTQGEIALNRKPTQKHKDTI
ncbi:MAG: FAD-dependent oxidoreductase [Candidatus Sedimenticola endophacoides]